MENSRIGCRGSMKRYCDIDIPAHGQIELESILMFKGGSREYVPFLNKCAVEDCTVYFVNERITVEPGDDVWSIKTEHIKRDWRKAADDYVRYITKGR